MAAVLALRNTEARDFFMVVLLTGLRKSEALDLKWEHYDDQAHTITIPDPKNRQPLTLPVSDYVAGILDARKKKAKGEYVFESERGRMHNLRFAMAEVETESKVTFCIHDLRRTFATTGESLDISGYTLKALLNHSLGGDVTAGYIVTDLKRLRAATQKVTNFMLSVGGVRPTPVKDLEAARKQKGKKAA